jgi:hypothetical protein
MSCGSDPGALRGGSVDFAELLRLEPDKCVNNVRNTASPHWQAWLAPERRCLVPFASFSEPDHVGGSMAKPHSAAAWPLHAPTADNAVASPAPPGVLVWGRYTGIPSKSLSSVTG